MVTSQARNYQGGNAVNLYRVDYADSLEAKAYEESVVRSQGASRNQETEQMTSEGSQSEQLTSISWWQWLKDHAVVAATVAGIALLLLAGWLVLRR